ncbi:NAD(P)-dependent dehydrogenase (short-subunit alcohol dehydrogenase family) [Sphingobium sp. OAS761]|uniref:SDR family oxidoreductase n=1 Tax=Sphingobium sp. OAS761 TaxID=2817901 RepID=UPI0020A18B98|nr:SDR family oxidoreductase [Sphingobium sp. OAS761]MCP1472425.1 NAD(P)-dependent dehydrogenase (short-subunit alcohol dehydrogenase family) [Sphingobium sp. OAS761]
MQLAVVVGAGGMGAAVARTLAADYRILLVDIDEQRAAAVADELREGGGCVDTAQCDITSPDNVAALVERIGRQGGVRVLAHVAGLSPTMGDFDTIIRVNLTGAALMSDALLPHAVPGAAAILISSLGAHVCGFDDGVLSVLRDRASSEDLPDELRGLVGAERADSNMAYQLSKFGLLMLARRRAKDWGTRGGRIVSLSPGLIATPMGAKEFANNPAKRRLFDLSPQKREGTMDEIADVVAFLASDKASFLSGTDILVDGGLSGALSDVPFDAMRKAAR